MVATTPQASEPPRPPVPTVIVAGGASGRGSGVLPTVRTILRTLDISAKFLAAAAVGRGSLELADTLLRGWATDIFRYGSATLTVTGREAIEPGRPYVVMSNHGSMTDIPALIATFPGSLRMVTKEELMRVPVWGRAMRESGFIPIDRKDRSRAIEQLEVAKERLKSGIAVWISPEGTRSRDGRLGPFKKGGFHLARQLQAEIVPAFVEGTAQAFPAGGIVANYDVPVAVHYGKPLPVDPTEDIEAQMGAVRAAILALAGGRLEERAE
jgi:1-acyl-sn-glycerol-3-phosphate acyltransferase